MVHVMEIGHMKVYMKGQNTHHFYYLPKKYAKTTVQIEDMWIKPSIPVTDFPSLTMKPSNSWEGFYF